MTRTEFEAWSREAERLRDEALLDYARIHGAEARARFAAEVGEKMNRL